MSRPRVLLLAYLVSPRRGSEYAVAWNHITWMAPHCELTVLYGAAGEHMGDFDEMADPGLRASLPTVRFVPVPPPPLARWLNATNRRGWLTYTFYLAYRRWHEAAGRAARELAKTQTFDLVHYLGPIGYREPGTLWQVDLPYVWGPIGGATHLPAVLVKALPWSGRAKLAFRAAVNWLQLRGSRRVHQALRRADVLLTATTENQAIFKRVLGVESRYLPENGVVGDVALDASKFDDMGRLRLIWIGSVEARKALKILVDALVRMRHAPRLEIHVVGDGPLRPGLQAALAQSGLADRFIWHGKVARDAVQTLLQRSHLHVITSVSEGNPTTIWEAMAQGVPTLALDHCGMHDTVLEGAGLKVAVGPYEQVVRGFAEHLDALAESPERLVAMAQRVVADAEQFHWRHRQAFWLARYAEAVAQFARRRGETAPCPQP